METFWNYGTNQRRCAEEVPQGALRAAVLGPLLSLPLIGRLLCVVAPGGPSWVAAGRGPQAPLPSAWRSSPSLKFTWATAGGSRALCMSSAPSTPAQTLP